MEQQLIEQARRVNELRKAKADAEERYKKAFDAFQVEHFALLSERKQLSEATLDAELRLRDLTVATFKETGNKHPAPGLDIRETTAMSYKSEEALKWAKEHQLALTLDRKAFEGFAKSDPSAFPFVIISTAPQATIATDLDKVLGASAPEAPAA